MVYQAEDRAKVRRQQAEAAIQLALQGRWDEAAELNKSIIGLFPADVDAYHRLGQAVTGLGGCRGGGRPEPGLPCAGTPGRLSSSPPPMNSSARWSPAWASG